MSNVCPVRRSPKLCRSRLPECNVTGRATFRRPSGLSYTDAFYVLEGELTFEIGREGKTLIVSSRGCVAVPLEVAHSVRNDSRGSARWLTIHAPDVGASPHSCAASATARSCARR
jgi:Cupin domain